MNPNQVLVKTERGREEIKTRTLALSQHARNLLIATDGQKTHSELSQLYSKVPDVQALLQELENQGLIMAQGGAAKPNSITAPVDGAMQKLKHATQYLTETANANLGFGGFTFTLKVGRCHSIDDVRALIPEYQAAVARKRGPDTAEALTTKLLDIIK